MRTAVLLASCLLLTTPAFGQRAGPKIDFYGDPLPPGAVVRLGTKRLQTKGGFGWTPDGKSLATLRGGTVSFWDLEDGHCRETLLVPIGADPFYTYGNKFVLSRDGQKLVCADFYGGLATWDLATSQTASVPSGEKSRHEENMAVALHPGGKQFVTLRQSGEIQFRDFATCQITRTITPKGVRWHDDSLAAFSPDGKTLVLAPGNTSIRLLDVEKGEERAPIPRAHTQSLDHIEFLPDGRLFSVGTKRGPGGTAADPRAQNQLLIWDLSAEPPTSREIPLGDNDLLAGCSAAFTPDGKTLVTVHPDRLLIRDVAGERPVRAIEGYKFRNPMHAIVKVDPTGKYVAVDDRQNYVRIWELASGKPVLSTERHHQAGIYGVDWSPNGERVATGDFTGEGRVWDAASGEPLVSFRGPSWGIFALRYTSDGTHIVICGDQPPPGPPQVGRRIAGPVRWHDAESGKLVRETALASRARLLTPSPDGSQWAAVTTQPRDEGEELPPAIRLLDAKTGVETSHIALEPEGWEPNALSWSADGKSLLAATNKKVIQFEAATGKVLAEVELPHFHQDRKSKLLVASAAYRGAFLGRGAEILTFGGLPEIYAWSLPAGEKLWTLKSEDDDVRLLVPSPDERLLAVTSITAEKSAKLRLFDLANRRLLATFDLGRESAERAAFSPDGNRLVLGCNDGTALVYDVTELRP
jgi:WD40 repeat protein